jgi:hypothetical protein
MGSPEWRKDANDLLSESKGRIDEAKKLRERVEKLGKDEDGSGEQ